MDFFDRQTIAEWKSLGYYYLLDENLKQWWIMGSRVGLSKFLEDIFKYSNDSSNEKISEHIHLGPHQYLKIMTLHRPIIDEQCIGGSLTDLKQFKTIIQQKLSAASIGEVFDVGQEYDSGGNYLIKFFVMGDNFDPSSIEFSK